MEVNELHHMCNHPRTCKGDITIKVTYPIGTSLPAIAAWIQRAPPIIQLFEDRCNVSAMRKQSD